MPSNFKENFYYTSKYSNYAAECADVPLCVGHHIASDDVTFTHMYIIFLPVWCYRYVSSLHCIWTDTKTAQRTATELVLRSKPSPPLMQSVGV